MSIFICGGGTGGITPTPPVETFFRELEDGSGFFQLEDATGNFLLE